MPQTVDDAEQKYGLGLYDRMNNEPYLRAADHTLKMIATNDGMSILPNLGKPDGKPGSPSEEDYASSVWAADFMNWCLDSLPQNSPGRSMKKVLWNLLDAGRKGHKLAEVTRYVIEEGEYAGLLGIKTITTKPRENYTIVLDDMNVFRGVMAKIPGVSLIVRTGMIGDASGFPNVISPDKLIIFSLAENDGDPRGVSWYRAAYSPWYSKQMIRNEELKTAVQFGGGMLVIELPQSDARIPVKDPTTGKEVTLFDSVLKTGMSLRNGGVGVFPNGTKVEVITPRANPDFFAEAISQCDREMVTAVILSARTLLEAKHGSRADTGTSQDLLDEVRTYIRAILCEVIQDQLVRPHIELNRGKEFAAKYCPVVQMVGANKPDFAANGAAVAALVTAKAISPSQRNYFAVEKLGAPPMTEEELEVLSDEWSAMTEGPIAPKGGAANLAASFRRND